MGFPLSILCWWTSRWDTFHGYCEQCLSEHGYASIHATIQSFLDVPHSGRTES